MAGVGFQFFFLASLCFMALEALQVYFTNIKPDAASSVCLIRLIYFLVGWGIPAVISASSALMNYDKYFSYCSCWLNLHSTIIYSTIVPAAFLSFIAIAMTEIAALGKFKITPERTRNHQTSPEVEQGNANNLIFILPVSVISWNLGLFAVYHAVLPIYCVVCAVNIMLGPLIGVFHSFRNHKVNNALKKLFSQGSVFRHSDSDSNSESGPGITHPHYNLAQN